MRRVLIIAILVLLAAGLHSWQTSLKKAAREEGPRHDLSLVVLARGALLPRTQNPLSEQFGTGDAIITGSLALQLQPRKPGLRAALFDPAFELIAYRNFEIAHSPAARSDLLVFCRRAHEGSVLALHNFGSVIAESSASTVGVQALERLLDRLGAKARPLVPPQASWCFIAIRTAGGWVPLAEAYSHTQGTALAFTLSPKTSHYRDYRGDWIVENPPRQAAFALRDELSLATWSPRTTWLLPEVALGALKFPALQARPPMTPEQGTSRENRIRWSNITLGARPGFQCHVALKEEARDRSDGVIFGLAVNGKLVASHPVNAPGQWQPWQVDLSPYAGETVNIELLVDPVQRPDYDQALWGAPTLSWQPIQP